MKKKEKKDRFKVSLNSLFSAFIGILKQTLKWHDSWVFVIHQIPKTWGKKCKFGIPFLKGHLFFREVLGRKACQKHMGIHPLLFSCPRATQQENSTCPKSKFPVSYKSGMGFPHPCQWFLAYVLGAQKNRLIETVLLSTHNICFGCKIRKIFFCHTLFNLVLMIYKTLLKMEIIWHTIIPQ